MMTSEVSPQADCNSVGRCRPDRLSRPGDRRRPDRSPGQGSGERIQDF